jgi:hypothetical protein
MRHNPFWFTDEGTPSSNLMSVYKQLKRRVDKYCTTPNLPNPEQLKYHVVGSNSNGTWKSAEDLPRLNELYNKRTFEITKKEIEFLKNFYSSEFIGKISNDGNKPLEELLYPITQISDLDIVVIGEFTSMQTSLLCSKLCNVRSYLKVPPGNYWNGDLHLIFHRETIAPYYSITENIWTLT